MNNGKICVSVCATNVEELAARVRSVTFADLVELRLDCLEHLPESLSMLGIKSSMIATFRPSDQGGNKVIDLDERKRFWTNFRYECGADLEADVIEFASDAISPKICSDHDFSGTVPDVDETYRQLAETDADIIKIAISAKDSIDSIPVWRLLRRAAFDKKGLIPVAMGEAGKWTRILGLAHGAYLTYASAETGSETAPGQITAREMIDVYRVKELDEQTEVYGIIAGDTSYTMSPYIHNAAFKAKGLNAVFVPFQVGDLDAFITRIVRPETREVDLNFRGFSVTNPHKQAITHYVDHSDEAASKIGAVNTIKMMDGKLYGYNTDAEGFISPLRAKYGLSGTHAAVIGAGGAARACIYALKNAGTNVTVFARDIDKAQTLSHDFDVGIEKLETANSKLGTDFSNFDIVVNSTPLGTRGERLRETAATAEQLAKVKLVYDLVYNPSETLLLQEAKRAGAETLGGFDMLMAQAMRQFEIWTRMSAPVNEMSAAAKKRLYDS